MRSREAQGRWPWLRRSMFHTSSRWRAPTSRSASRRSEEHTSELQSQFHLVCRLLLEKKHRPGKSLWEYRIIRFLFGVAGLIRQLESIPGAETRLCLPILLAAALVGVPAASACHVGTF